MNKTWQDVVDELAEFIDEHYQCDRCPATKYCDEHPELAQNSNHGCYLAINAWAKEVTGYD